MDNDTLMDALIDRARNLLCWMDEAGAAVELVAAGVDPSDAFLAVHAAVILHRDV